MNISLHDNIEGKIRDILRMNTLLEIAWDSTLPYGGQNALFGMKGPKDGAEPFFSLPTSQWEAMNFAILEVGHLARKVASLMEGAKIAPRDDAEGEGLAEPADPDSVESG